MFARVVQGRWIPLTKAVLVKFFDEQIAKMNLNPKDFSIHSFRRGVLQRALLKNISVDIMRSQSDHSSEAIMAYLGLPVADRFAISEAMGSGL